MNLKSLTASVAAVFIAGATHAQASPYMGEQNRTIKSLSEREVEDLLSGQGMGLAKAAELNGYPGPTHVLRLADQLKLSEPQRSATQDLLTRHKAMAREMGARLVEAERALDRAFAHHHIDHDRLAALTAEIGRLQAQLRAEHLGTHLAQTALLSAEQAERYARLRGYAGDVTPTGGRHRH